MTFDGKYYGYDIENKLILELILNPDKKKFWQFRKAETTMDYLEGGIYKVNNKFITKFQNLKPRYYKF